MSTVYGITAQDVLNDLPANTRGVASGTQSLSTEMIESWIATASGIVTSLVQRTAGLVDEVQADTPARAVARDAILAYATAKALSKGANPDDPRIARAWERWDASLELLRDHPTVLGDAQPTRVVSNVAAPRRHLIFRDQRW